MDDITDNEQKSLVRLYQKLTINGGLKYLVITLANGFTKISDNESDCLKIINGTALIPLLLY